MTTIKFRLEAGDKNYGEAYLPDHDNGRMPVLIRCHGGGNGCDGKLNDTGIALRDRANNEGMAFVTFDCFAAGETGGDYGVMTYARWVQNLSDIIDWVQAQPFADPGRIGVIGYSCGSTVALRAATQDPRLRCVCSIATCATVHIGMWGQGGAAKCFVDNLDALLAGERRPLFGVEFQKEFFIDDISNAPVHALLANEITCPVLFLQGAKDNVFRCSDARLAYDIMHRAGQSAKYIEYEEGGHGLGECAEQATNDLFSWLREIDF